MDMSKDLALLDPTLLANLPEARINKKAYKKLIFFPKEIIRRLSTFGFASTYVEIFLSCDKKKKNGYTNNVMFLSKKWVTLLLYIFISYYYQY